MISSIEGKVTHQNETHVFIHTGAGLGFKIAFNKIPFSKDEVVFLYTSQTFRENGQDLYGFTSLKDLEIFELLCTVKGVGAKSAFSLINSLGAENVINAISIENKKILTTAPGIGNKAASQIILDLQTKITKINWSSDSSSCLSSEQGMELSEQSDIELLAKENSNSFVQDAIMACKELGFKEADVLTIANKVMRTKSINSSEQLIQQVLKGI